MRFNWLFHYSGSNTSTACVTDQTCDATRAGSGYARLLLTILQQPSLVMHAKMATHENHMP